jgi:nitric oxide reductase activation protein
MQITESSSRRPEKTGTEKRKAEQENSADTHPKGSEPGSEEQAPVGEHLYDEWSEFDNDYYRDYCLLREIRPRAKKSAELPADLKPQVRRVKRLFEFIKPSRVEKEKYCDEGDAINHELLVDYITQKKIEPSPKVNFYEKITINTRDIAVLVLLDVSGSTGNEVGEKRVLDLERNAALILGEGLKIVGDPFGVCGFSGQGRENCEFFVYKDFAQAWDNETIGAILEARPKTSTRMGVALRHAGSILSRRENRKKLLILITDGKAMDAEYDSSTMYAQYDVRKAVQENRDAGINCFAISTDEESQADMQLMFPGSRYCIVPKIERLPQALPALYLRLTL